jgi:glycosyltransferase involved in cell wall biosynthesis
MKIALIAPPFISVPPKRYGGTELVIAHLADGLGKRGFKVILYANGESTANCELRYLYQHSEWPISGEVFANVKDLNHTSWAVHDCWNETDIIHLNNSPGLAFARFSGPRFVYTIHHPHDDRLSEFYSCLPRVDFVTISHFQQNQERLRRVRTIHHGVDMRVYKLQTRKQPYLCFLGRIAPVKGPHLAIEVARRTGIPLKIAGEVQPAFKSYFESQIKPHLDGKLIEFLGEADVAAKNELFGNAMAMLFPIQWNEPFGLVMIEAMATGTPVLALPGGAVQEVVADNVSGWVCNGLDDMVAKARQVESAFDPASVRGYAEKHFSVERMVDDYAALYREISAASERPARSKIAVLGKQEEIDPSSIGPGPRAIA